MTIASSLPAPKQVAIGGNGKPSTGSQAFGGFLADDPIYFDMVINEQIENKQHRRMLSMALWQSITIAALAILLMFLAPIFQPVYRYYAVDPAGQMESVVGLTAPNMTNRAILSWSINRVTEILTIGFGDFELKLNKQRLNFVPEGWKSFVHQFLEQDIGETFKHNQLVLTTVPSNVPVIIEQGQNKEGVYEWRVQMPVVMTYTTNNNQTQHQHSVITLTVVRVPLDQNPDGVAIKVWHM